MDEGDGYFGERVAARYDESSAEMFEPGVVNAVVEVLAELAAGGRALELGVGTFSVAYLVFNTIMNLTTQAMSSNCVEVVGGRGEYTTFPFRYVWPANSTDGPARRAAAA